MTSQEVLLVGILYIIGANGQCILTSPWASSTWLDNTRGTITFSTTAMTGWSTTVFNQPLTSWDCFDNSSSTTLIMRSTSTVAYSATLEFYAYLCLQLTQITQNSYSYVQQQVMQSNAGNERIYFTTSSTPLVSEICSSSVSIPTLEFHVLVKNGMGESAAIKFPDKLLFSADYQYQTSDGGVACNGTSDTMDMCTNTTALSFNNYPNCNQEIAYSAGGELWCVATASLSSYDCAVVFNRDATISGTASQFACLCSDGSSVSVVSGNCTSDQSPSNYPTGPDGTAIGYRLLIETIYVDCAPKESSSSAANTGLIVGLVVLIIILIAVTVVVIILYKRGHCVTICGKVNSCLDKTPCWATCRGKLCVCCKNKVAESEQPMLTNGAVPHAEMINETSTRGKLTRDKTSLSAITRSSSVVDKREKSELEKSLIRQGTVTSITGIDIKSARSSVQGMNTKTSEEEPRLKCCGLNLSFLVCCPEKKEKTKAKIVTVEEAVEKSAVSDKKKPTKAAAGKKGAKGKAGKGGKGGKKDKKEKKSQEQLAEQPDPKVNDKTIDKANGKLESKPADTKVDKPAQNGTILIKPENNGELTRAPTKMMSDLRLTSTPVPGGEKGQKGVVSVPAGLQKPTDKPTEWTFLSCCFGNRLPQPEDKPEAPEPQPVAKKKGTNKPATKGQAGGAKKAEGGAKKAEGGAKKTAGKKGGGKGTTKKKETNENDLVEEDLTEPIQPSAPERSKTMPEREKTILSLQDAQGIKVDVYVPDDKTNLQLKDTVTVVKSKNGGPLLEKAKTDIGVTRPPSSRPTSSAKSKDKKEKGGKKSDKKAEKGKEGGKKASKDKKGGKKKKK